MNSSQPAVDVARLDMSRGNRRVLHGLDFGVARGPITGLLGPRGCGKDNADARDSRRADRGVRRGARSRRAGGISRRAGQGRIRHVGAGRLPRPLGAREPALLRRRAPSRARPCRGGARARAAGRSRRPARAGPLGRPAGARLAGNRAAGRARRLVLDEPARQRSAPLWTLPGRWRSSSCWCWATPSTTRASGSGQPRAPASGRISTCPTRP